MQDQRTQVQGGVSMDAALQLDNVIDTLLTDRYRLELESDIGSLAWLT